MANAAIGINNLEQGKGACDTLESAIKKLDVARQTADSAFDALSQISPDLGQNFIHELTESLGEIYAYLNKKLPKAREYFVDENPADLDGVKPSPNPIGGGGYGGGGGGGGGRTDPKPDEDPVKPGEDTDPNEIDDDDVVAASLDDINTGALDDMKLVDMNGFIDEIIRLANQQSKYLDEILELDDYSESIKKLLMDSPYVPEEFKKVIADMDDSTVRLLISYILKANSPEVFELNTLNLGVTETYLEDLAEQNGISVKDLLGNKQYAKLLRDNLAGFDTAIGIIKGWEELSPEAFQSELQLYYYGDVSKEQATDQDILTTRAYVDYLSDTCNVYYEELLTNNNYAETLKEGALELGKSLTFLKATSYFTDDGMMSNVRQLLDGSNYKVYGMTKDDVGSFQKEMDTFAKENNISVKELLEDAKYADKVKEALANSEAANGVGAIYKKSDASVSQEVAKNLYNTKFEKSKEQKELDKIVEDALKKAKEKKESKDKKSGRKRNDKN